MSIPGFILVRGFGSRGIKMKGKEFNNKYLGVFFVEIIFFKSQPKKVAYKG